MYDILLRPLKEVVPLSDFARKAAEKCFGGNRVIDALFHFPSSVIIRSGDHNNFRDKLTLVINVTDHIVPHFSKSPYKIIGQTDDGVVVIIVYFHYHAAYLRKTFAIGSTLTISGSAQKQHNEIIFTHPDCIGSPSLAAHYIGPEAIYPATAKLSNKTIRYIIKSCLKLLPQMPEWIPQEYSYISFSDAVREIHSPKSTKDISITHPARYRIALDELLANQIRLKKLRDTIKNHISPKITPTNALVRYLELPFDLTADQQQCLEEIKQDLVSGKPMNRLIQGDVGSGKTIVAFIAMLILVENNAQAALLAPTEILACQHFKTMLGFAHHLGINIDLMISHNRKIRQVQLDDLMTGKTNILVGTHAILEDNIQFQRLGLVVIDEQHRFGVEQRLKFIEKTNYPNILSMSATPIPRTLLLGCYGDLDVSIIKHKPATRKDISTVVIGVNRITELITRMQNFDGQIFWVCPVIEESETLTNVNSRCEFLRQYFGLENVGILHGKMKSQEKDDIMKDFRDKKFKILVATVVIEVGIDIPNANMIVIEHAERFGLAQLHQLRGRVGRGSADAYCVLLYHYPVSEIARTRLNILKTTSNGFEISEQDLKLRGAGDILGKEQSGFTALKFSDFANNSDIISQASEIAAHMQEDESTKLLCNIFRRIDSEIVA